MDERLRFVGRLLEGDAMCQVGRDFGISRKTGYKIFSRYKGEGLEALTDRSRRPVRYANQLPEPVETMVVGCKREKNTFPSAIRMSVDSGLLHPDPVHFVTKHLQQGIESDHFRVKKNMCKIGGFQSFNTARRTIAGFEVMPWLRKGFGFSGDWTVNDQNDLLAALFGLTKANRT